MQNLLGLGSSLHSFVSSLFVYMSRLQCFDTAYWLIGTSQRLSEVSHLGLLKEENPWGSTEYLRFTRKMMIRIMYICCSWRWMKMNILRITCGSTGIHWREIWTSYASHPISTGPLRHLSLLCFSISGYCVYKDSLVYSSFTFNFIADHVLMSVQTSELCHKITMLFCKFIIGMVRCLSVSLSHTHTSFGVFAAVGPAGRRYWSIAALLAP